LKYISSEDPQARIKLRRMQGKIRKIITKRKRKLGKFMFYSRKLLGW